MSDDDAQTDELVALAGIYDETSFSSQRDSERLVTGVLTATVELPRRPFHVHVAGNGAQL